jgi:GNAT superfamily N-acetyltransferase
MNIRKGTLQDLPQTLELIKELALYEKALDQVTNTVEQMEKDGFGSNPLFGFFVAEQDTQIIGISLYYFRYSTWKGKRLYLEDIIVTEKERGTGCGRRLFERTMRLSIEENCSGMIWQVLNWNEPAINFYKKYDARIDGEWLNCHLEFAQIEDYLKSDNLL